MADIKLTRQQIYDRIRETSKEEFILVEMKRLGFWGKKDGEPGVPELLIKKETELQKELNKLSEEKRKFQNREAVVKEMRMKRMAEAKVKRELNKKKREQERFDKAEAWKNKKATEIIYLGENVSLGLNHTENNIAALQKHNLPVFANETELAIAMGIDLKELRFLAFNRKVSEVSHYRKFYIPKKSGGRRLISAPMPRLKKVQYWILQNLLNKVALHKAANGFVAHRSIVSNAQPHVGKDLVLNMDVKDFFPSVHFKRTKGLLQQLGYSEKISTILSLICTEAVTDEVEIDGKNYFVQKGNRVLPQGAPTSPAITNILCFSLDNRLQGLANKLNCNYTRYADDITFSGGKEIIAQQLVWRIKRILQDEGFTVHPGKIRIMCKGTQQEVTGVIVNQQLSVNRKDLRQFRALLHNLKKGDTHTVHTPASLSNHIIGYANFVKMVNPVKGTQFKQSIVALFQNNTLQMPSNDAPASPIKTIIPTVENNPPANNADDKPWWKVV
ncbi:MAG: RNA-directed polymerase [Ferruginibacter sp.]|nr:RNA-directed polymerase [Ferruginibacter sp.]